MVEQPLIWRWEIIARNSGKEVGDKRAGNEEQVRRQNVRQDELKP